MTGVRAYERRADLRAYNQRLLDYAKAGGTVIVQYNKFEFNDAQYGPYPAKVGRERVTDENAEMKLLAPKHPVFNAPNQIGRADWTGWVQERGLYFLDDNRARSAIHGPDRVHRAVRLQPGRQARRAGRGEGRAGPLDLRRPRLVAAAARGHGRCIPADGESAQPSLTGWLGGALANARGREMPASPTIPTKFRAFL